MSAESVESPRRRDFKDASPREIRAALVPEERPDFDRQWQRIMAEAIESLDLTSVFTILDSWRRRATLTTSLGHGGYRRMLARAEQTLRTGEPATGSVPLDQVKAYIEERLGR
ncbi:DUF6247 family protein [Actinophytocola sp.]|uniref:DUF6247 family protein n=1 Tax=Actinophytocola sp. TaxID=1872138 RepID=UPI0025B8E363|nr:DUF6247 family protein [Actinophytocola sp.]